MVETLAKLLHSLGVIDETFVNRCWEPCNQTLHLKGLLESSLMYIFSNPKSSITTDFIMNYRNPYAQDCDNPRYSVGVSFLGDGKTPSYFIKITSHKDNPDMKDEIIISEGEPLKEKIEQLYEILR